MNVREVPEVPKDVEHQYIAEDSKTRIYLSVVRKFDEWEYEEICIRRERERRRKRLIIAAKTVKIMIPALTGAALMNCLSAKLLEWRGSDQIGSELLFVALTVAGLYLILDGLFQILGADN